MITRGFPREAPLANSGASHTAPHDSLRGFRPHGASVLACSTVRHSTRCSGLRSILVVFVAAPRLAACRDHPIDHYPDDQKVRTLSANGRPNVLCVALKPIADEFAYPFRGEDQIQPDWRAKDIKIPVGKYLLRLSIHGKGIAKPARHLFEFENLGANQTIALRERTSTRK